MPRRTPVKEVLKEEEAVASSPVRRSSRLNTSSPAPVRVLTRRNSSETSTSTPKPTRGRRSSLSQESSEPEKKAPRARRNSQSSEPDSELPLRRSARTASLTKEPEENQKKRRRSVTEGSDSPEQAPVSDSKSKARPVRKPVTPIKKSPSESIKESPLSSIEENDKETSPVPKKALAKADFDLSIINEASITEEEMSPPKKAKLDKDAEKSTELSSTSNKENISPPKSLERTDNDSSISFNVKENVNTLLEALESPQDNEDNFQLHFSPSREVEPMEVDVSMASPSKTAVVEDITEEINKFLTEKFVNGEETKSLPNGATDHTKSTDKPLNNEAAEQSSMKTRLSLNDLKETGDGTEAAKNPSVLLEKTVSIDKSFKDEESQELVESPKTANKSLKENKVGDDEKNGVEDSLNESLKIVDNSVEADVISKRKSLNNSLKENGEKSKSPKKRDSLNKSSKDIEIVEEKVKSPQVNKTSTEVLEENADSPKKTNSFNKDSQASKNLEEDVDEDEDIELGKSLRQNQEPTVESPQKQDFLNKSSREDPVLEENAASPKKTFNDYPKESKNLEEDVEITHNKASKEENLEKGKFVKQNEDVGENCNITQNGTPIEDNEDEDLGVTELEKPKSVEDSLDDVFENEEKSPPKSKLEVTREDSNDEQTAENIPNEEKINTTAEISLLDNTVLTKKRTSRSSLTIQETVKIGEDPEETLSERIHKAVDFFCSGIKNNTADVSVNVSLDYQEADSEEERKKDVVEVSFTALEAKVDQKGSKRRKILCEESEKQESSVSVDSSEESNETDSQSSELEVDLETSTARSKSTSSSSNSEESEETEESEDMFQNILNTTIEQSDTDDFSFVPSEESSSESVEEEEEEEESSEEEPEPSPKKPNKRKLFRLSTYEANLETPSKYDITKESKKKQEASTSGKKKKAVKEPPPNSSSKIVDNVKKSKNKKNQSFEKTEAELVPCLSELKERNRKRKFSAVQPDENSFRGKKKLIKEDLAPTRILQGRIKKRALPYKPSKGMKKYGKTMELKPSLKGFSVDWEVSPIV